MFENELAMKVVVDQSTHVVDVRYFQDPACVEKELLRRWCERSEIMVGLISKRAAARRMMPDGPTAARSTIKDIAVILAEEGDKDLPKTTDRTIVFACMSGHHGSVGWSFLICGIFGQMGFDELALKMFPNNPRRQCHNCAPCAAETSHWQRRRSEIYQEAGAVFIRMNEDLGYWW